MTTERETQPQDAALEGLDLEGASDADQRRQTGAEAEGDQTGAEQQKPAERVFGQAEVSKMESSKDTIISAKDKEISAKDAEIAQTRRDLAILSQQVQQDRVQTAEQTARGVDARAVDDGEITQSEAVIRQTRRATAATEQETMEQDRQAHRQMKVETEVMARIQVADKLAEKHGVDAKVLLEDDSLSSGELMEIKAREIALEIALEKLEADRPGTESFDAGVPRASAGGPKSYLDNLKSGEALPSAAEIDRITARYSQA